MDGARNSCGITYVVPAFNCVSTLEEAIASICTGNLQAEDEIIVVDDCSTDTTPDLIAELAKRTPRFTAIRHGVNKGTAAAARNTAICSSSKDFVLCLDSDNVLAPGSVPALKAHLLASGADAAAFGEARFFEMSTERVTHKMIYNQSGWVTLADALSGGIWPGPSGNYLFTRKSWEKAGRYFEPTLLNQTLDSWTFGICQLATGSGMAILPGSYYFHRWGHASHFVRQKEEGNVSLAALAGLLPFLDLIEDADVDYIMSRDFRYSWFENLDTRPLQVKSHEPGRRGVITKLSLRSRIEHRFRRMWHGIVSGR